MVLISSNKEAQIDGYLLWGVMSVGNEVWYGHKQTEYWKGRLKDESNLINVMRITCIEYASLMQDGCYLFYK